VQDVISKYFFGQNLCIVAFLQPTKVFSHILAMFCCYKKNKKVFIC